MTKRLFTLSLALLAGVSCFSQKEETLFTSNNLSKSNAKVFKVHMPAQDKTETFTVTGIGSLSFTASNTADGTADSYNHSQRVILPLMVSSAKPVKVQVIFYGDNEKMRFAAENENDAVSVYYPQSFFQEIKQRLEQSIASKKKIVLTVTQKTTGFREAVLQF